MVKSVRACPMHSEIEHAMQIMLIMCMLVTAVGFAGDCAELALGGIVAAIVLVLFAFKREMDQMVQPYLSITRRDSHW
jgi:hypothetical protein